MFGNLNSLGNISSLGSASGTAYPGRYIKGATWDQDADSYTSIGVRTPVHDACKICLVTPGNEGAGDVVLNQYDYTRDAQGNAVALDGSQGHVMLRIPKVYYRYSFADPTHSWGVSLMPRAGFALHPAFIKAGVEVPYRYIGVYKACGYDVSAGSYVDGDGINSWLDRANDKFGSIVGKKPITNFTRSQGRTMAANVGTGWQMRDFWLYNLMKLLYITKYADLDSQSVLGAGNTRWSSWDFATRISATGKVVSVTAAGQSTAGGDAGDYCNLLGVENPYGDIWEFVDGWNILDGNNYICASPEHFADNETSHYSLFGSTNPTSNGWQDTLQSNGGFLPASIGANSTTNITDYYWYSSGWMIALVGGNADRGASAGLFALAANSSSSHSSLSIGARLCY